MSDTDARSTQVTPSDLRAQTDSVLAAAATVLRAYKMDDVADLAARKAARDGQARTVVVVGEVKRGKSSLVNALVGRRDLSPVGVDVTTTVAIGVAPTDDPPLDGTATLLFPDRSEQIPLTALPDWVTVGGRQVRDPHVESLPTRASIPVTETAMPGVTIVDTPGVGGLDPAMAALAVQSAQQACVVVIVCDASSPLTAPEMDFIREAGASVDALVVAVTKTDKNIRRWKAIVADNRRLLTTHLQRDIPVIGVSSLRAVLAADLPPGAERDRAEMTSGITDLRAEIMHRLDAAQGLPAADALRTTREGLLAVARRVDVEHAAVAGRGTTLPDLTAQLDALETLKDRSREWEQYLARDLTQLRQQAIDDSDRRLDEIRARWTTRINKSGMEVLRRSPQKFTADMQDELERALAVTMAQFLEQLYSTIVAPRFDSDVVWEQICGRIVESLQGPRIEAQPVGSRRHGLFDPTLLNMGIMGSSMIGGVIGLSTALGVGAIVGTVWVGVNLGFRAMRTGKTNLLAWLRETLATTKTVTARLLELAIAQARPEIVIRYREHLRTAIEDLQRQIGVARDAATSDATRREKDLARLDTNRSVIAKRLAETESMLARVSAQATP
ncbi:dynamin family protein [Williamsia herbipolensis]|uniref:dynamin family protein n=1 Tax=Williamsia herbipolensis TaxID=1603258 RepID=UPI0005F84302|nr:dynamin family protein [Williamsia herbipolensis]